MSETDNLESYDSLLPEAAQEFGNSVSGEIEHSNILYICDHVYPFLQLAKPEHNLGDLQPNVVVAKNGWKIIDYGDVLSVAALHDKDNDVGNGTIVKQQFDVAFELMNLVKQRHWRKTGDEEGGEGELKPDTAQILGGTPMMQRFAWFAAQVLGIKLEGFVPTAEDQKWLETLYNKYVAQGKAGKTMKNE